MTAEQRATLADTLRTKLNSRRDVFVLDRELFETQSVAWEANAQERTARSVSAATLRLLLDYCESAWEMDLVTYCAGIFHGREARDGECAFDLLPDVQSRLSADRLGLGHIYGDGGET